MNLKGFRTKISAVFAGLPTAAAAIISQFDPQLVLQVVADYPVPLACYQGLTYIATHYYRDQATPSEPAGEVLPQVDELQTQLELEIAQDINGDIEND